jgi:hypothetical protein
MGVIAVLLGAGLIVILSVLGFRARSRKRRVAQFGRPTAPRLGNAPQTAIRVKTPEEITAFMASFKCGCGKRPYKPEAPPIQERFSFDEQPLVGVRLKCSGCGLCTDLYFNPAAQNAGSLA